MSSAEGSVEQPKTIVVDLNDKTTTTTKDAAVKRTFTVVRVSRDEKEEDFKGGRFQSKTPAGAARKAANQACKTLYNDDPNITIEISIRETTKNHPTKEYPYKANRTLNTKNVDFKGTTGGVNIPFKYSMNLKSLKKTASGKVIETPVVVESEEIADSK